MPTATIEVSADDFRIGYLTIKDIRRFCAKIHVPVAESGQPDPRACWEWTAGRHNFGYGTFWVKEFGYGMGAHVVAAFLAYGDRPDGLYVLHSCDNPPCCNPVHLRYGTAGENMADRDAKKRGAHGERAGLAKLTDDLVRAIRFERSEGALLREIAERYEIHTATVHNIIARKTWSHVA